MKTCSVSGYLPRYNSLLTVFGFNPQHKGLDFCNSSKRDPCTQEGDYYYEPRRLCKTF